MALLRFVVEPSILSGFLFYAAIVLVKTLVMSFLTARQRFGTMTFANPEDAKMPGAKVKLDDPNVERVRRCHLNDLENVYLFVLLGLLYCLVGPNATIALWHFRIFAASRIGHTIVYLNEVRQPARALCFMFGVIVCASMAIQVILATF